MCSVWTGICLPWCIDPGMQQITVLIVLIAVAFAQNMVLKDERDVSVTFSESSD